MRIYLHFKSSDHKQYMKYFNGKPLLHVFLPSSLGELQFPIVKSQVPIYLQCFSLPSPVLSETHAARSPPLEALRHGDEGYCLGPEYQGREQTLRCPAAGWNLKQKNPNLYCYVLRWDFHPRKARPTQADSHRRADKLDAQHNHINRGLATEHAGTPAPYSPVWSKLSSSHRLVP